MNGMSFRIRDVLIAGGALCLLSPLFLLIILLLWGTQGQIFFTQLRPGYREKPFRLFKFSTMRDAPAGWREEERQQDRLTPLGRILRKTSLDELPQLWNVLRGEMTLVGPRPLLMSYLPLYQPIQRKRHDVLPGITGWAQIKGRNTITFTERFEYDLWYVDHKSFWLDTRIMFLTISQVFRTREVFSDSSTTSPMFDGTN